jgi:tetratricopeptide (TPR) repeat protein
LSPYLRRKSPSPSFWSILFLLLTVVSTTDLNAQVSHAVKIVAPDKLSVKIHSQPSPTSEILGIAFDGDILEVVGPKGNFIEIKLPDKTVSGFVAQEHTVPWSPPAESRRFPRILFVVIPTLLLCAMGVGLYFIRSRKQQEAVKEAVSIPATIKRAEELYRAGEFSDATKEFNRYLAMHGGDIRNPDVYRRLAVCYQRTDEILEAVRNWEKMREIAGLKRAEDYMLGVDLMSAIGSEARAAEIYEEFLETGPNEETTIQIHEKLFHIYLRLDDPKKLLDHAVRLLELRPMDTKILTDTVDYLIKESHTDLAAESDNKVLVKAICKELLDDKISNPEAGRIYLKCLEYDRTDLRIHRMLADMYTQGGDFRRAVSELTILHQLDKEQPDSYIEEAARLYVDNDRVSDALAEGNPLIIKKVAQIFLSKSQVHPDAVAIYERVLELQPRAVGINKMLATVYLTRGELDKYMARLRILHEIDGENHDYLNDLAICIIDNGLVERTINEGNRELNASILKHLIKSGAHDDKTIALLEKLINYEPENVVLLTALIRAYENRNNYRKGFEYLLHLIMISPENKQLVEKARSLDSQHRLLEHLLKQGQNELLVSTALALMQSEMTDTFSIRIMEAVKTEEPKINEYLMNLNKSKKGPAPERKNGVSTVPLQAGSEKVVEKSKSRLPAQKDRTRRTEKPKTHPEEPKPEQKFDPPEENQPQPPADVASVAPPPHDTPEPAQTIQLVDSGRTSADAVTTFVSGYAKGRKVTTYDPNELFRPSTGGLAYKDTTELVVDGWGSLNTGVEATTGRNVLMRIISKDLLEPDAMKDFLIGISDIGYNLVHDNVLRLEDLVSGRGGTPALIYPYCPVTLENVLQSANIPELQNVILLMGKIIDAVAFAHQYRGLDGKLRRTFHLHLQPSSVLLSDNLKDCRVCGFGYSQVFRNISGARQPRWQEPGMNPATMPPEFFSSQPGIIREKAAEIYSLGILMYFAVTGEYPFTGPSLLDYKLQHRTVHATPPRLVNPITPSWLEFIIMKCLEKDPDKRWDNVSEIQKVFREGMNTNN